MMPPGVAPTGVTVGTGPPGRKVAATKQASLTAPGGSKLQAADPCVGVGVVNPSAPGGAPGPDGAKLTTGLGPNCGTNGLTPIGATGILGVIVGIGVRGVPTGSPVGGVGCVGGRLTTPVMKST